MRPFPGSRQREGAARGISPSSLWSYKFREVKRPSSPDLHVQRGRINYSITHLSQGRTETWEKSCPGSRASSQPRGMWGRDIPHAPNQLPLSCSTPPRRVPTQSPSQQPAPEAGSPWGQHSLPKIISDIWDHTSFTGVLMSGAQGLTDFFFYSSSTASPGC